MADYLFCVRKKNNARIDVRICREKCPFKDRCAEFLAYQERFSNQSSILDSRLMTPTLSDPMASEN